MIMTRSAYKFWSGGKEWPREIAYKETDIWGKENYVTYNEISQKKTARQHNNLERNRSFSYWKPCFVWVFENANAFPFGGWYLYIKTLDQDYSITFRNPRHDILKKALEIFPCGVLPFLENFDEWCKSFANTYTRKAFKRDKNQGLALAYALVNTWGNLKDLKSR